jgi:hypothetical protein
MPTTLQAEITTWKANNPKSADETQAAYDARAADMASLAVDRVAREDAAAAAALVKQQFVDGLAQLQADLNFINGLAAGTNLTGTQTKDGFRHVLTSLIWLGNQIKDGKIVTNV